MNLLTALAISLGVVCAAAVGASVSLAWGLRLARRRQFLMRRELEELAAFEIPRLRLGDPWRVWLAHGPERRLSEIDIRRIGELSAYRRFLESSHALPAETSPRAAAQRKKESMSKAAPKTFYYLDESQVRDLYPQAFAEPEPKEIETQEEKSTTKGIKAALKIAEPSYERSGSLRTKKTFDVELTPPIMYNKVEQFLFSGADLTFGIEDFEPDESAIKEFRATCSQMKAKFNFTIPDDLQTKFVTEQKKGIALERRLRVSQTTGYVALQGDTVVCQSTDQGCTLRLVHPLNSYLGEGQATCFVDIICRRSSLTPSGSNLFRDGGSVKVTCVGKVVCWDATHSALVINPIAVY